MLPAQITCHVQALRQSKSHVCCMGTEQLSSSPVLIHCLADLQLPGAAEMDNAYDSQPSHINHRIQTATPLKLLTCSSIALQLPVAAEMDDKMAAQSFANPLTAVGLIETASLPKVRKRRDLHSRPVREWPVSCACRPSVEPTVRTYAGCRMADEAASEMDMLR